MGQSIQVIHSSQFNIITQEKSGLVKLWTIENNSKYTMNKSYECNGGYCKSIQLDNNLVLPQKNSTLDIINLDKMEKIKTLTPGFDKLGNVMCLQKVELGGSIFILAGYETGI